MRSTTICGSETYELTQGLPNLAFWNTRMKLAEKTLELTLCHQLGATLFPWPAWPAPHGVPQPIWFGLTQKQEAAAGFDAVTRLHGDRLLLLQFKAGRKLKNGSVRF